MINCTISIQFFLVLKEVDLILAKAVKQGGCACPGCGGILDVSNYPRKPRGIEGGELYDDIRFSFTCRKCRKRVTAPSVRYLGRKVYVGLCVCLAMSTEWLQARLMKICKETLARWRGYWNEVLNFKSRFWRGVKGVLPPDFQACGSPIPIVELYLRTHPDREDALSNALKFFLPLSVWRPSG